MQAKVVILISIYFYTLMPLDTFYNQFPETTASFSQRYTANFMAVGKSFALCHN